MEILQIYCLVCSQIDQNLDQEKNTAQQEIEFYCKSCKEAVCRNCLLLKHLALGGSRKS